MIRARQRTIPAPIVGPTGPRRPRWKGILLGSCLFLVVLMIGLAALSVVGLVSSFTGDEGASITVEETVVRGTSEDKVAVIPIQGPIGLASESLGASAGITNETVVQAMLTKASEDPQVKAIVLDIDSPGGGVVASRKIYEALAALDKPIVAAYTGNFAASGAVYLSMAADKIVAYPDTITGSIGVIAEFIDLSKLLNTYGVQVNTITTGKFKDIGSSTRPMTDEEHAMIEDLINEAYEGFVATVASGRNMSIEQVKTFADGRIFSGTKAQALGLVDELGNRERAETLAEELGGLTDAQIVEYQAHDPFAPFLSFLEGKLDTFRELSHLLIKGQAAAGWQIAYRMN